MWLVWVSLSRKLRSSLDLLGLLRSTHKFACVENKAGMTPSLELSLAGHGLLTDYPKDTLPQTSTTNELVTQMPSESGKLKMMTGSMFGGRSKGYCQTFHRDPEKIPQLYDEKNEDLWLQTRRSSEHGNLLD